MRVLMLGWEFPPHISGGLGTACYGLTKGLDKNDVEVLFVVPRAHGDEDQTHARILGCNHATFPETSNVGPGRQEGGVAPRVARSSAAEIGSTEPRATESIAATEIPALMASLEILEIDSPLSPYLTEESYRLQLLEALERKGLSLDDLSAVHARLSQDLQYLKRTLGSISPLAKEVAEEVFDEDPSFEFSGVYGPNLFAEVARYAARVAQIAETSDFDVIHAHDWMTYPAGLMTKKLTGKPLVVHLHACEYDRSGEHPNTRVRDLEQLGFAGADRVVCVSRYTARQLARRYELDASKLRVVHNAVEQSDEVPLPPSRVKSIEEPIILFLGRITFQKGPDYFLAAARKVIEVEPRVKFVMAGSGDMWPEMVERSARMGLAKHISFTGFLRGEAVQRMYDMADVYVMPSVSEPFGISPLEAMARDVPVIVSKQSGVSEILDNALKVDFWDVEDLASKMLALIRYEALDESLRRGGREEIAKIRWERPAAIMKDIYRELIP